jgi:hypothetical protein
MKFSEKILNRKIRGNVCVSKDKEFDFNNWPIKTNYIGRANKYVVTGNISTLSKADKDSNC